MQIKAKIKYLFVCMIQENSVDSSSKLFMNLWEYYFGDYYKLESNEENIHQNKTQ